LGAAGPGGLGDSRRAETEPLAAWLTRSIVVADVRPLALAGERCRWRWERTEPRRDGGTGGDLRLGLGGLNFALGGVKIGGQCRARRRGGRGGPGAIVGFGCVDDGHTK
jgi:hypothetical protein